MEDHIPVKILLIAYCIFVVTVVLFMRSSGGGFPGNAKLCGDYWVSCKAVKDGMYRCRVFDRFDKKLISDKTYIYPFFYANINGDDLSGRITKYDRGDIYFDGKKKLVECDIPQDAVRIQCLQNGAWITCKAVDEKENLFYCTVYSAKDGSILSEGAYDLNRFHWDPAAGKVRFVKVKEYVKWIEFVYYGGIGISLKNKMVLMPIGWIDYPDGPRSGLRVKYEAEGKIVKEEEYES